MNMQNEFDPMAAGASKTPAPTPTPEQRTGPSTVKAEPVDMRKHQIQGVNDAPIAGVSLSDEALKVKEKLSKETRVPMFVPLDPGEKPGAYRSVTINGYRCEVKKGKMIALPMSIAKILMDAYQIEAEVLNENKYNLNNADTSTRRALGVE